MKKRTVGVLVVSVLAAFSLTSIVGADSIDGEAVTQNGMYQRLLI
jgi:hypothetical protein